MVDRLITQFLDTPNGGDVMLQAVPTEQQTADALAIATAISGRTLVQSDDPRLNGLSAFELISTRLKLQSGSLIVGSCTDSTGNDVIDWPAVWARIINSEVATSDPDLRIEWVGWNDTGNSWNPATVIKAGTTTPAVGGTIVHDTFSRTGDLAGSTPDSGPAWQGNTPAGAWTSDGNLAKASAAGAMMANTGSRDATVTTKLKVVTSATSAAQTFRIYLSNSTVTGSGNGVYCIFTLPASGGGSSLTLYKRIGGVQTQLQQLTSIGLTGASAVAQDVTFTMTIEIQNITVTWTTPQGTFTLTGQVGEDEYAQLGYFSGIHAGGAAPGVGVDEITISTPFTPAQTRMLQVRSASKGGGTLQYQMDRLATQFPADPQLDVVIIAHGHNYADFDGDFLTGKIADYITALREVHPNVIPILSSQNPEFPPATTVEKHRQRQAAVRLYARQQGWAYIPAMEAFMAQPDGGQSLVEAAGIHPTTPPAGTITPGYGATLWAQTFADQLDL